MKSAAVKFLFGLAAVIAMGWVYHAPMGRGAAYIDAMETVARAKVAEAGVPGITVEAARHPLARILTLSGPADQFQRNGMGEMPGLTGRVAAVDGVRAVRWADEGGTAGGLPLFAEFAGGLLLAYLLGLLIGWLLFGRPKRDSYL